MRKFLMVVAVALVCAAAASSASAALHTGSATGPIVLSGTVITFTNSGNVTWQSAFFATTITCTSAALKISSSNYGTNPVALSIPSLSQTSCSSGCGSVTVSHGGFPWSGSLATTTPPNGTFSMSMPGQNITITTCGLSCSYGTPSGGINAPFTAGGLATIAINSSMTNSSCFDTANWKATFVSSGPAGNGLFLS